MWQKCAGRGDVVYGWSLSIKCAEMRGVSISLFQTSFQEHVCVCKKIKKIELHSEITITEIGR